MRKSNHATSTKTIAVAQNKGGTGKTTTVINLGYALATNGYRVLAVDLDPQANLTLGLNFANPTPKKTIANSLDRAKDEPLQIYSTKYALDIIAGDPTLNNIDSLINPIGRDTALKRKLKPILDLQRYEFILLDTPPALGLLTTNAAACADYFLIPMQLELYCFEGLSKILEFMQDVKAALNPDLRLLGVFPSQFLPNQREQQEFYQELQRQFEARCFQPVERRAIISQATTAQEPVKFHAPKSESALNYEVLAKEIIDYAD